MNSRDDRSTRRVVWLVNDFDLGGAQQGLVALVRNRAFEGVHLTVVVIIGGAGAYAAELEHLGVPVVILHDVERMKLIHLISGAGRLWLVLGRLRPSAVILSLPQANIVGRILSWARGVPVIASFEHNSHLASPIYEVGFRLTSTLVDWTIADCEATASEATRRLYLKAAQRRTILPLVSFSESSASPVAAAAKRKPFVVVNAGRFTTVKNQAALIRAARLLLDAGHDVELKLYGDGKERRNCEVLVAELALQGRVHFMGHVKNWWDHRADLFVLVSLHEGLCIALLEAMAAGIPAAAPLIGGVRDYGGGGGLEILADVEPRTIATAIAQLMADPNRREEMARIANAAVAERFGDEATARLCEDFAAELRGLPCR